MSARSLLKNILVDGWPGVMAWETEKTEESLYLEFKGKDRDSPNMTDKDWARLAQAMSAFANSDGGVFVFGPHTTDGGKNYPDRVQSIVPLQNVHKLTSAIQRRIHELTAPPIAGVKVEPVENPDVAGSGIIVIYIPGSDSRPHRSIQGASGAQCPYYMRSTVSTLSMGHAVLAEQFGRRPMAKLYLAVLYSISRYHSALDIVIGNMGRGHADRPAVSFVQYPDLENPDRTDDVLWHMLKPARGWDNVVKTAGVKEGTGAVVRAAAETVLYPGMELLMGFLEASPRPSGRRSFRLSIHGTLYAVNASPARFGLVQDLEIQEGDLARNVGRIDVPAIGADDEA